MVIQNGPVGFASVVHWNGKSLRHQKLAHGHIGDTGDMICVRLLEDGRSFLVLCPMEIRFFSFGEMQVGGSVVPFFVVPFLNGLWF